MQVEQAIKSGETIFSKKNIAQILEKYKNKTLSPVEVAQECISQVEKLDSDYHAWVCFDKKALLEQAKAVEAKILKNEPLGELEGIPVGVKDIYNTTGFPTQMGSPLWKDFTPGNDARVVYYLKNAGAIIPGKTVTAEFAVHTLDETLNPHDITKTPGTSSSGSAVAVALGMLPVAIGTQTAGSIVRPASFCGIYGYKPSFGLMPRTGMLKTTDSLDTIGYFTANYVDLERVFNVMRIDGPNFPISYRVLNDKSRQTKPSNRPWKVGFVKTHTWENAYDYAQEAVLKFVNKLAENVNIDIEEVELPYQMTKTHEIHATIYNKTLSYYFKEEFKKAELVSPIMNDLITQGNRISVAEYHKALEEQNELCHLMDELLENYDAIISLSTAGQAPPRDEQERPDPALMWNMTHLPVINVPAFVSPEGLPFGAQLVARKYNDFLLFSFADYLQQCGLIPEGSNPTL